jgi:ATP phosphoribosyltransferase
MATPMSERVLKIGFPAGSLQEATINMFRKAGFSVSLESRRTYVPRIDDPELTGMFIRAQEIPRYVEDCAFDCGLTGKDWILERGVEVVEVADLVYAKQGIGRVYWVLAVPNDSSVQRLEDLKGKRIATELVEVTRRFLADRGVAADVEFSWGATEAKLPALADAIVEATETGNTLRANNLRIVETLFESTTKLIANQAAWADPWKRSKIESIAMLLQGALLAEQKVGLKMNVRREHLSRVVDRLPALKRPTVSDLSDPEWVAIETVIDESVVREIIPELKQAGAQGIIEYPLNKVIP